MTFEPRLHIHVAAGGDDSAAGTVAQPFATLQRAQQAVRERTAAMDRDIIVNLHAGVHILDQPLRLSAAAGDSGANGHRVIYEARGWATPAQETVTLSGGRRITGWQPDDAEDGVWRAEVGDLETRQLYVDGVPARRARLDLGRRGGLPGEVAETDEGYLLDNAEPQGWENPEDIELVYLAQPGTWYFYSEPRLGIAGIEGDANSTRIVMAQPGYRWFRQNHQGTFKPEVLHPGPPTRVENSKTFLTEPGEFYLDRSTSGEHVLFYIPRAGEDLESAEVVAPALEQLIDGSGEPEAPLRDVTFRGITFTHATWLGPNEPTGFSQVFGPIYEGGDTPHFKDPYDLSESAQCVPGNVRFRHSEGIVLEDNRFTCLGGDAIELSSGSSGCVVRGNVITDICGGAIQLGARQPDTDHDKQNGDNVVENNLIQRIGVEFTGSVGIYAEKVQSVTIAHNQIDDCPYIGIVIGEFWTHYADGETTARGNRILCNRVFNVMKALWDGGGIWTAAPQGTTFEDGALVAGNVVHDTAPPAGGPPFPPGRELDFELGYGLMIDDFSHFMTWRDNVAYRNGAGSVSGGPELHQKVIGNFWDDDGQIRESGCYEEGSVFEAADNVLLEGDPEEAYAAIPECAQIVAHAGLESAYRHLVASG